MAIVDAIAAVCSKVSKLSEFTGEQIKKVAKIDLEVSTDSERQGNAQRKKDSSSSLYSKEKLETEFNFKMNFQICLQWGRIISLFFNSNSIGKDFLNVLTKTIRNESVNVSNNNDPPPNIVIASLMFPWHSFAAESTYFSNILKTFADV